MLDTSCTGSFMKKTIEFKWDLLGRIKRNSEDWELVVDLSRQISSLKGLSREANASMW
jgi:hypothetical protein